MKPVNPLLILLLIFIPNPNPQSEDCFYPPGVEFVIENDEL